MIRIPPLLAAVAAAAVLVSMSPGASARPQPSQAALASTLARKVESAGTPAARYQALVAVMRALRIGVYTSAGKIVAGGAERSLADLYFYDFELRALAAGLAQGTTSESGDLAAQLAHAGLTVRGKAVTAPELESAIAAGTHKRCAILAARTRSHPCSSATWVSTTRASIRSSGCSSSPTLPSPPMGRAAQLSARPRRGRAARSRGISRTARRTEAATGLASGSSRS